MLFSCQKSSASKASHLGGLDRICMLPKVRRPATCASIRYRNYGVARTPNFRQLSVTVLVELTGIEPVTPWLQTRCSPS